MIVETPCHYTQGAENVLWQLLTGREDERGFHSGANVSMLSQFAAEEEELFPPLTMLRVLKRERMYSAGERALVLPYTHDHGHGHSHGHARARTSKVTVTVTRMRKRAPHAHSIARTHVHTRTHARTHARTTTRHRH